MSYIYLESLPQYSLYINKREFLRRKLYYANIPSWKGCWFQKLFRNNTTLRNHNILRLFLFFMNYERWRQVATAWQPKNHHSYTWDLSGFEHEKKLTSCLSHQTSSYITYLNKIIILRITWNRYITKSLLHYFWML